MQPATPATVPHWQQVRSIQILLIPQQSHEEFQEEVFRGMTDNLDIFALKVPAADTRWEKLRSEGWNNMYKTIEMAKEWCCSENLPLNAQEVVVWHLTKLVELQRSAPAPAPAGEPSLETSKPPPASGNPSESQSGVDAATA
ncbi:hypothetical protein MIND_00002200 [Mycena indigotica]|uniref:Uncharacterized protein n=1 Tax=Mycena indigotica TaxID=2126181 RepID=A0A8H6T9Z0_9AGAR|nr:uncharacterized protein MIND_00002200 [Mycena indigotica]KAF7314885.1 hypothetical protein MIND_00002200 [Mycena indigotica]